MFGLEEVARQRTITSPKLAISIEEKEIDSVLISKNIKWLCHFTPRENLDNIKKNGLLLRNNLSPDSLVTDKSRFDRYKDAICLSISKPNKWMLEKKREQGFDLCLLLINPAVLYKKKCLFYPHNAATASYRNIDSTELMGKQALENLFSNTIYFQKSGKDPQSIWRNERLTPSETTSDQAEVQCLENIDNSFIDYIIEDNIPLTYNEIHNFISQKEYEIKLQELEKKRQEEIRLKELERKRQEEIRLKEIERKRQEEIRLKEIERKRQEEIKLKELERKRQAEIRLKELERNRQTASSSGDRCLGIIILVILLLIFIF